MISFTGAQASADRFDVWLGPDLCTLVWCTRSARAHDLGRTQVPWETPATQFGSSNVGN